MRSEENEICVLMGGTSEEREVSLNTGENVFKVLKNTDFEPYKYVLDHPDEIIPVLERKDLVFNCLHGGIGEDGTLQSLFEILGVPYTGTGPLGSAVSMNKLRSKQVFEEESLPNPAYLAPGDMEREDFLDAAAKELGFPLVVKPIAKGSSIGVKFVNDEGELDASLPSGEGFSEYFVEEYLPGRELTVGLLEMEGELHALPVIELRVKSEPFYNYRAKYTSGETEFLLPAPLEEGISEGVKDVALKVHEALGCRGYSRVDFILWEGKGYILEENTLPGLTETSNLSKAAREKGLSQVELIEYMLRSAIERRKERNCKEGR